MKIHWSINRSINTPNRDMFMKDFISLWYGNCKISVCCCDFRELDGNLVTELTAQTWKHLGPSNYTRLLWALTNT